MSGGGHLVASCNGFTLAEVLITLGIIGVVAAMTLPALIQNTRHKELEAGLKKGASEISQALNMYQAENGEPIVVNNLDTHELKPELIKYFKVLQDCGYGYGDSDTACIKNYNDPDKNSTTYKNFTGTNTVDLKMFDDGQFVLTSGAIILINNVVDAENKDRIYISIDVNGYNKRPNRLGQDLFMFQIDNNNNGKLLPMGAEGTKFYSETDAYCSKTSTNLNNGAGCTYKALSDPTFWRSFR